MDCGADRQRQQLLQVVRELGPTIARSANDIERMRDIPDALFDELVEHDLFRLLLPAEYGGMETPPPQLVRVLEEVARHDASTAWCLGQNNVCSTVAAYLQPDAVAEIFDSPRAIVAWGPGPGEARVESSGYRLNGRFDFASGSRHATWLGAHVAIHERDGTKRLAPNGSPTLQTLLFPRHQAQVEDTWHVLGLRGTGSDSYEVRDIFVPHSRTVSRNPMSLPRQHGPAYVFTSSTLYASSFAGIALGIAQATFDAFVAGVRDTVPRGASRSRGANNVVQSQLGQSAARIRSARMYLLHSLDEIWDAVCRSGEMTHDQRLTIRLASTWAIQQSREVVSSLYLAAGAMAIFESRPFERRFRDIHTLCQQIQGHAAHFETVGQVLMGMEPDRPLFTF